MASKPDQLAETKAEKVKANGSREVEFDQRLDKLDLDEEIVEDAFEKDGDIRLEDKVELENADDGDVEDNDDGVEDVGFC